MSVGVSKNHYAADKMPVNVSKNHSTAGKNHSTADKNHSTVDKMSVDVSKNHSTMDKMSVGVSKNYSRVSKNHSNSPPWVPIIFSPHSPAELKSAGEWAEAGLVVSDLPAQLFTVNKFSANFLQEYDFYFRIDSFV